MKPLLFFTTHYRLAAGTLRLSSVVLLFALCRCRYPGAAAPARASRTAFQKNESKKSIRFFTKKESKIQTRFYKKQNNRTILKIKKKRD
ncbi:hypothetical protein [Methanimicrococcus stummii]|uniref:hypothetical protein n=1 Tax=Methanimicrococcus stummii TaxID=3028294 RepID=UPI0029310000|nr:hypothetical protein [Methanimicrococcus sp. Es2]